MTTTIPRKNTAAVMSFAITVPSSVTIGPFSATIGPFSATIGPFSATIGPFSVTTVPSSATTVPSSATTTASSLWSIIQSPPSTLTPIVDRYPGNPLNLNDRPASYIETMRYLESENSRLKREGQTTQETFTREMSNIEAVLSNKRKLLDEADTERVKLELNIKRLRDDNEDLKNKLEEKTKNLQIAERNAMIHEKCSCDLQSWAKCKTLTEIESSKQAEVLLTSKHWMKERDNFAKVIISRVLCVSWESPIEGSIFLPQTAAYMQTQRRINSKNCNAIIHQALKEVLFMFSRGEDLLIDVSSGREDSPNSQASPLLSFVGASSSCQLPMIPIPGDNLPEPKSFTYLLNCYSRIAIEERNHGKNLFCNELFTDAANELERSGIKSTTEIESFVALAERAAVIARDNRARGDAPEEFRDPLMDTYGGSSQATVWFCCGQSSYY